MESLTLEEAIKYIKEVVCKNRKNKEKNTIIIPNSFISSADCAEKYEQVAKWLEELKSYKEAEEQGLLVRLPHKVGEEVLKELSYGDIAYGGNCTYEVRMEAIKALKKQIPMKPNNIKFIFDFSGRYYTTKGNCPVCNREEHKTDFYCNKCGQKLDWGEKNDR